MTARRTKLQEAVDAAAEAANEALADAREKGYEEGHEVAMTYHRVQIAGLADALAAAEARERELTAERDATEREAKHVRRALGDVMAERDGLRTELSRVDGHRHELDRETANLTAEVARLASERDEWRSRALVNTDEPPEAVKDELRDAHGLPTYARLSSEVERLTEALRGIVADCDRDCEINNRTLGIVLGIRNSAALAAGGRAAGDSE